MRALLPVALIAALMTPAAAAREKNRAVIDIGSSSIKMLVVDGQGKTIADVKIGAGLGKKIGSDRKLPQKNRDRAVTALRQLIERAAEYGIEPKQIDVFATAAVRNAANGKTFVKEVLRGELGLARARILSGEQEATLGFRGASRGWHGRKDAKLVVVDIGGGSHQVVVGRGAQIESAGSTQIGSHFVNEKILDRKDLAASDRRMAEAVNELPIGGARGESVLLIGGTAKFLRHFFKRDAVSRDDVAALRLQAVETGEPVKRDVEDQRFSAREREMLGLQKKGGKNAASLTAKLTLVLRLMDLLEARTIHLTDTDARHALVR